MRRAMSAGILFLGIAACGPTAKVPAAPEQSPNLVVSGVHAEWVTGGVRVTNGSNATIRFHVVNPYWLGLLVSCTDAQSGCTSLSPSAQVVVPTGQIHGLTDPPSELVVRYWRPGDEHPTLVSVTRN